MQRRAFLTGLATTLAATAGCIDDGRPASGTATDEDEVTDTGTGSDTPAETDTRTPTDVHTDQPTTTDGEPSGPTPPTASDVFADMECPSFSDSADRTVCYHETDSDDASLLLTAEPEVSDQSSGDDGESLAFVLYNRSEWSVGFNPYDWGIERYDDGEWTHVAPDAYPEPWTTLPAGERFSWSLSGESADGSEDSDQQVSVSLDPGTYAFHVTVQYDSHGSTGTDDGSTPPDGRTELVALFRIE